MISVSSFHYKELPLSQQFLVVPAREYYKDSVVNVLVYPGPQWDTKRH